MNDISSVSKLFKAIIYADDTTLTASLEMFSNAPQNSSSNINSELAKISKWLKLNKLSLNVKKSKFILFHMPQKKIVVPNLSIDNTEIECVDEFNFLGITIHKHLKWDPHISSISRKIVSAIGIIYQFKHVFSRKYTDNTI